MSIVSVAADVGCPGEDVSRNLALRVASEFVGERRIESLLCAEYGSAVQVAGWAAAVESVVARLATAHHLILCFAGCEQIFLRMSTLTRVHLTAPEDRRVGNIMVEKRLDRPAAKGVLRELDTAARALRKLRFGKRSNEVFDLALNVATFEPEQAAAILQRALEARGSADLLTSQAEAQIRFQSRLVLASHGISANAKTTNEGPAFGHPSEQTFANLLDFYRVAWQYEPRSFPLQWDKDGNVLEAFTPDFYLAEFDMYVEITTMKQSLVTRKNRKVKLLKAIYPHVNIQVFYQKDFQDLLGKYGLTEDRRA